MESVLLDYRELVRELQFWRGQFRRVRLELDRLQRIETAINAQRPDDAWLN